MTDAALRNAVIRARSGQIDAQLGTHFIKQEIARPPEGRKTACRAIIAFRPGEAYAVVMHVYAKSAKSNLSPREAEAFADLSVRLVALTAEQIRMLIRDRGWKDVEDV